MNAEGVAAPAERLREVVAQASRGLVEREVLVELLVLGAVAGEHVLVIGPPGTAKSEAVRRVAGALGGRYFEYLLGKFTEPAELFGPIDLAKLKDGVVDTDTAGMLPEAEIAFLDEVFLGSTAILNTLLAILNERTFRRGQRIERCPLIVGVGASNALPEDESLAAFADRFLLRLFVEPIADAHLEALLGASWRLRREGMPQPLATADDVRALARRALELDTRAIAEPLAEAVRLLRKAGIALSDRRVAKCQSLVAAAAALSGRDAVTVQDLWPIVFAVPTKDGQERARDVLRDTLAAAESRALVASAEDASAGPRARALRLERIGREVLGDEGSAGPLSQRARQLRLEGVAREIDASFAVAEMPAEVRELRARVLAELGSTEAIEEPPPTPVVKHDVTVTVDVDEAPATPRVGPPTA